MMSMWSHYPLSRHPGESRDPFIAPQAGSAARIALIQWAPAFAGVTSEKETA